MFVPAFKREDSTLFENYRLISLLPIISKICERITLNQITTCRNEFLSPCICTYRKKFNPQTALFFIRKWKQIVGNKDYGSAILIELSKAFDTISHEILIAKLHAYGFTIVSHYYPQLLVCQHVQIDSSFSSLSQLTQRVQQESVLGPHLLNIYLNGLVFALKDIEVCNCADDITPFDFDLDFNTTLFKLEENLAIALTRFETNTMKLNSDKLHLLISGNYFEKMFINFGSNRIWENKNVELLEITIGKDVKFHKHVNKICSNANRKINLLSRMQIFS